VNVCLGVFDLTMPHSGRQLLSLSFLQKLSDVVLIDNPPMTVLRGKVFLQPRDLGSERFGSTETNAKKS